jgi:fumarate hydratase subunit beta
MSRHSVLHHDSHISHRIHWNSQRSIHDVIPGGADRCTRHAGWKGMFMKEVIRIHTPLTAEMCATLSAGDLVLLSGTIYTGRDVAHKRLHEAAQRGEALPLTLEGETIFYAAPTPAMPGAVIGSIGPTTSSRMDPYTPLLIESGLKGMIGKGKRSPEVLEAIKKHKAVYFGAMGGVAALMAQCIKKSKIFAYPDLGPESMLRLEILDMPLVVVNDIDGRDLYKETRDRYHI